MGDYPHTICFKAPGWMKECLDRMAEEERRTMGQMVRVVVERYLEGLGKGSDGEI